MLKYQDGKWILLSEDGSSKPLSRPEFLNWLVIEAQSAGVLREADFEYQDTSRSNIADWLESTIHKSFTMEADGLLGAGHVNRDERIMLSGLIGDALSVFSAGMDVMLPELRTKPIIQQAHESYAEQRDLSDVWARDITEAAIDAQGNLSGIVVVEGESKRGNVYTMAALESGPQIFAGKPIFADHPSRSEDRDRPERSVRDLVGKLPEADDMWVAPIADGPHAGRHALFYKNAILSETADWLRTLIREKIAGAQSINAFGGGDVNQDGKFQVEAFLAAKSLDFVTSASAGGKGQLQESNRDGTTQTIDEDQVVADFLESLTLEGFAKLRPDILNDIGARERAKVYGKRKTILQEATMSKALVEQVRKLRVNMTAVNQQSRLQRATATLNGLLAESSLPANAHALVRALVEGYTRRFIEQEEPMAAAAEGEVTTAIVADPDLEASDPPTILVPAEVPPEKAEDWVKAYLEATKAGTEPTQAVHVAWAAIINGGGEVEIPEDVGGAMVDTFTEAQLAEAFRKGIRQTATLLSEATGAGSVTGMGGADAQALLEQAPQVDEKAEKESWMALGLTEAGAAVAMRGRGRHL